jgi:hypothetical protein
MTKGKQVLLKLVGVDDPMDVRLILSESGGAWFESDEGMESESLLPPGDTLPLFLGKERAVFFPSHRIEWMLAAERHLE